MAEFVMKVNRIICPSCRHEYHTSDRTETLCDACGKLFLIGDSLTSSKKSQSDEVRIVENVARKWEDMTE